MASKRWATIVVVVDGVTAASWELTGDGTPTLMTVDALARLHLDAQRLGWELIVDDPCQSLCELVQLAGLEAVFAA